MQSLELSRDIKREDFVKFRAAPVEYGTGQFGSIFGVNLIESVSPGDSLMTIRSDANEIFSVSMDPASLASQVIMTATSGNRYRITIDDRSGHPRINADPL